MTQGSPGYRKQVAEVLVAILKAAHDLEQAAFDGWTPDSATGGFQAQLVASRPKLQTKHLESILQRFLQDEVLQTDGYFLYLEPLTTDPHVVPVMTFRGDFATSTLSLAFRVMLYHVDVENREVDAVGFRFEIADGGRLHDYNHVQMISTLDRTNRILFVPGWTVGTLPWVPERQPAFPLDAPSPICLVLCMLVSLYGPAYLRKLKDNITQQRIRSLVQSESGRMHSRF